MTGKRSLNILLAALVATVLLVIATQPRPGPAMEMTLKATAKGDYNCFVTNRSALSVQANFFAEFQPPSYTPVDYGPVRLATILLQPRGGTNFLISSEFRKPGFAIWGILQKHPGTFWDEPQIAGLLRKFGIWRVGSVEDPAKNNFKSSFQWATSQVYSESIGNSERMR